MLHNSAPDMAVYVFEHLSLIEVKQVCFVVLKADLPDT